MIKKIAKFIYYLFCTCIIIIVLLLMASMFPIAGNYKVMVVQSGSMQPTIKTGSVVVSKPQADYRVGDIISFAAATDRKMTITHRITEIKDKNGQISYVTKGDANNGTDSSDVSRSNVFGRVLFSVPYAGYVVNAAKKPYGFIAIIVLPSLIIIFDEIKKIMAEISRMRKEKNNIKNAIIEPGLRKRKII